MLGRCWQEFGRHTVVLCICVTLGFAILGCSPSSPSPKADVSVATAISANPQIEEVSPPEILQQLSLELDQYDPQLKILGLESDETVTDTTVNLRLQVKDFPIYKDAKLGLGPHIHVLLDNQPYQTLYDVSEALTFKELSPGTHTVRAFLVRPWDESFKTAGASDQVTFHVFAPTQANRPNPTQPLLTYNNPQGEYGAEPIMLDYFVTPPIPKMGQKPSALWNVKVSLNGQSFKTTEEAPIYLRGFKPGINWLKLELLDASEKPIANTFSETVRLITLKPNGKDTLSQLVRGELTAEAAKRIVDRKVSKRLTEQEKAAQEEQEEQALAAEAAAKRENAKLAVPTPKASVKDLTDVESEPIPPRPRLPNPSLPSQNAGPSEPIAKPTSVQPLPSKAPAIQASPTPTPFTEKAVERQAPPNTEAKAKQEIPLWSKLKSSLFSSKTSSEAQPNAAPSIPSNMASPRKTEDSIQSVPQISASPVPLKIKAPPEIKVNPGQVAKPASSASPQTSLPTPISPVPDSSSLDAKISTDPLEPLQKFLDFQPLDPENLPVIQQKEAVKIPSRYTQKSQTLNQAMDPLSAEVNE